MKIILQNSKCQLVIGGKDHIYAPKLAEELRDYMSINVPGAFHSELYKKHIWDGKKYFITPKRKEMPTGFLPILLRYLDEAYLDLDVFVEDMRDNVVTIREDLLLEVGDQRIDGDYEHQSILVNAYKHSINFRGQDIHFPRGVIDAATNAGKTTIFAALYINAMAENKKMLLLIHRKLVYRQLVKYFKDVFGTVGQINDKYYDIQDCTIAMVQSLNNRVKQYNKVRDDVYGFNILAVDESHTAGSSVFQDVIKYSNAYMRVFMSGTALDSSDPVSKLVIIGSSGPKLADISKVALMNKGISTPINVSIHLCNTLLTKPLLIYDEWIENCIHYSPERVAIMSKICDYSGGKVLIAVDEIHHGQYIFDNLDTKKNVLFTNGKDKYQIDKVDSFVDGDTEVLITTGILKEGVNIQVVTDIIYALGGKSKISVKQWMGRGERLFKGKEKCTFHDFYDVGKYVKTYSEARMKMYESENLPVLCDFALKDARKLSRNLVY